MDADSLGRGLLLSHCSSFSTECEARPSVEEQKPEETIETFGKWKFKCPREGQQNSQRVEGHLRILVIDSKRSWAEAMITANI